VTTDTGALGHANQKGNYYIPRIERKFCKNHPIFVKPCFPVDFTNKINPVKPGGPCVHHVRRCEDKRRKGRRKRPSWLLDFVISTIFQQIIWKQELINQKY
jgi:hypothetical protein